MQVQGQPTSSRRPVESSSLVSVGYERGSRTLEVEFRKGGVYRYFEVPATLHESLLRATSKGRFFATEVRDRFPYARVSPSEKPSKQGGSRPSR
jgi:hypothetical protein